MTNRKAKLASTSSTTATNTHPTRASANSTAGITTASMAIDDGDDVVDGTASNQMMDTDSSAGVGASTTPDDTISNDGSPPNETAMDDDGIDGTASTEMMDIDSSVQAGTSATPVDFNLTADAAPADTNINSDDEVLPTGFVRPPSNQMDIEEQAQELMRLRQNLGE